MHMVWLPYYFWSDVGRPEVIQSNTFEILKSAEFEKVANRCSIEQGVCCVSLSKEQGVCCLYLSLGNREFVVSLGNREFVVSLSIGNREFVVSLGDREFVVSLGDREFAVSLQETGSLLSL